jgi:hypothetical protein
MTTGQVAPEGVGNLAVSLVDLSPYEILYRHVAT